PIPRTLEFEKWMATRRSGPPNGAGGYRSAACQLHYSNVLWQGCDECVPGCRFSRAQRRHPADEVQFSGVCGPVPVGSYRLLLLPEHSEAADRIPHRSTHDDVRQEVNIEREA